MGLFHGRAAQSFGPEDDHDMVTGATEQTANCHDMTGVHDEVTYCPPSTSSESRKRTALQVNRNFAAKIPLRQLRQTKFCWPFSSWQITLILRIFTIISTYSLNCQSHRPQQSPRLTGKLKNLSFLKTFFRRVSKFITS